MCCAPGPSGAAPAQTVALLLDGSQGLAFCILDLDNLKSINAQYLHHGGDAAIRYVASHFKQVLRRSSDWAARRGRGDEFAFVLISEKSADSIEEFAKVAKAIAEFLRQKIAQGKCPMPGCRRPCKSACF